MSTDPDVSDRPQHGRLGAQVAAAVVLLSAAVVLADAIRIAAGGGFGPSQPGFFPLIVGIGLVCFGIAFLVRTTVRPDRALLLTAQDEHASIHWRTLWLVIGGLVLYAVVLEPLGYIPATSLFFVATTFLAGSRAWVRNVIVAVAFSVAVYFGFTELLGVRLPNGLLEGVL